MASTSRDRDRHEDQFGRLLPVLAAAARARRRRHRRDDHGRSKRGHEPARYHLRGAREHAGSCRPRTRRRRPGARQAAARRASPWSLGSAASGCSTSASAPLVGLLAPRWQGRIMPWVFVIPAIALLTIFLVYPTIGTIITSFTVGTNGDPLAHYKQIFSPQFIGDPAQQHHLAGRRHGGSVILGLLIAAMVDRVRREALAKTFIFLPLAISFIGAVCHLALHVRMEPAGPAADRRGQRRMDRARRHPGALGAGPAGQHLRADRDLHLAPDRLRHGRPLGSDQGRLGRSPRGGPPRWRQRAADLLQGRSCRSSRARS